MCKSCQDDCEDCRRLLAEHSRDELCECDNCGHLFLSDNVVWVPDEDTNGTMERCYCKSCHYNIEAEKKRLWREQKPEEYCRMRRLAYGFLGCQNCPIGCVVQPNQLNILSNIESVWIEEIHRPSP